MILVNIEHLTIHLGGKTVLGDVSLAIHSGEHTIIKGPSGSGKTVLAKAIAGKLPHSGSIEIQFDAASLLPAKTYFVESWYKFKSLEGERNFYYQQRYNHQQKKETSTVKADFEKFAKENNLQESGYREISQALLFEGFCQSQLIELSSGEHKKLQLIKALWFQPQLLIIDQPYIGLDSASRSNLNTLLDEIAARGTTLILVTNDEELPESVKHSYCLKGNQSADLKHNLQNQSGAIRQLPNFLNTRPDYVSESIVSMKNVNVSYGDKKVLEDVNWQVNAGERWLLQGHNGSGKSTLLSLITGDHPQAYANDIRLFNIRRGHGESIWDIKKRIGLISPEFHWYFDANATVLESVASGLFDTNGLYQQLTYSQKNKVNLLLDFFEIADVKNELLTVLPLGKQRLALLARTIIKNPQLLILDEPCQGLDTQQTDHFNKLIDEISKNGITIIYVGHFETQIPKCIDKRLILSNGKKLTGNVLDRIESVPVLN